MTQYSGYGSSYSAIIQPQSFQRRSLTLRFSFLILLDVTKYSRRVHQSPNLWRYVL